MSDPYVLASGERAYPCVCHVCGLEYVTHARFMSAGITQYGADGRERAIRSCGKHPPAEVRAAYLRITGGGPDGLAAAITASQTEAARDRFGREITDQPQPRPGESAMEFTGRYLGERRDV